MLLGSFTYKHWTLSQTLKVSAANIFILASIISKSKSDQTPFQMFKIPCLDVMQLVLKYV